MCPRSKIQKHTSVFNIFIHIYSSCFKKKTYLPFPGKQDWRKLPFSTRFMRSFSSFYFILSFKMLSLELTDFINWWKHLQCVLKKNVSGIFTILASLRPLYIKYPHWLVAKSFQSSFQSDSVKRRFTVQVPNQPWLLQLWQGFSRLRLKLGIILEVNPQSLECISPSL